jgi:hypothetical protein
MLRSQAMVAAIPTTRDQQTRPSAKLCSMLLPKHAQHICGIATMHQKLPHVSSATENPASPAQINEVSKPCKNGRPCEAGRLSALQQLTQLHTNHLHSPPGAEVTCYVTCNKT